MRWPKLVASALLLLLAIGGFAFAAFYNPWANFGMGNNDSAYNVYGEVPIPGQATLHLPAGQLAISFHAETVGVPQVGLPVPELKLDIDPPDGVAEPQVTEKFGGTTSINNDSRRQVWVAQIPQDGDYRITTDGQVSAFISARLAFGRVQARSIPHQIPVWIRPAATVLSTVAFIAAIGLFRSASTPKLREYNSPFSPPQPEQPFAPPTPPPAPGSDAAHLDRLKTLADLHASGALTDDEFETEKRRIIGD
jgi:Short C-terminal domain